MNQLQFARPARSAGLVTDTSFLRPTIRINGNEDLRRELNRDFIVHLEKLLRKANLAGEFVVTVGPTTVKGTSHTRGLRIGLPNRRNAVELTWQGGSNDSRVPLLLSCPAKMDAHNFQSRLKAADSALEAEEEAGSLDPISVTDRLSGKGRITSLDLSRSAPDSVPSSAVAQAEASPALIPSAEDDFSRAADEAAKAHEKFVDDLAKIELLMHYLEPHVDVSGCVRTSSCTLALRMHFGCMSSGPILRSMASRGHIQKVTDDSYKLNEEWREKIGKKAKPAPAPTPEAEVPPVSTNGSAPTANLSVQLKELTRKASIASVYRSRIVEIDQELTQLDALISMQEKRRDELRGEKTKKEARLGELTGAEQKLSEIQQLLR